MLDNIHQDHSKIKVGILVESPFLPVSNATKRAMDLTRRALVEEGYNVIDTLITPEEFAEGRNILLGIVVSGFAPTVIKDLEESGEVLTHENANMFSLVQTNVVSRWLINHILRFSNMGRAEEILSNIKMVKNEDLNLLHKRRYQFCNKLSKKW